MVTISRTSLGTNMLKRAAFTMIELIFAIVIIGVTVLTVPLMIETNNKALEGNIAQEAIFLVSSVLSTTTALVWDEKSITSTGSADNYVLSKILDVGSVGSTYGRIDAASTLRIGGLREDKHRQFFDYNGAPTAPLQVGEETLVVPLDNSVAAIAGYKQAYTIVAKRVYVSDTIADPFVFSTSADAGQTNLKMTEISINGEDGAVIANLRAYTANIGEVDYAKRSF